MILQSCWLTSSDKEIRMPCITPILCNSQSKHSSSMLNILWIELVSSGEASWCLVPLPKAFAQKLRMKGNLRLETKNYITYFQSLYWGLNNLTVESTSDKVSLDPRETISVPADEAEKASLVVEPSYFCGVNPKGQAHSEDKGNLRLRIETKFVLVTKVATRKWNYHVKEFGDYTLVQ
jgi:hypothetical protein